MFIRKPLVLLDDSGYGQAAAGGAGSGAAAGTAVEPGFGTVIGAAAGALVGLGVQYFNNQQANQDEASLQAAYQAVINKYQQNALLPPAQAQTIPFQDFAVLQQYAPQIAQYYQEQAPQLVQPPSADIAQQAQSLGLLQGEATAGPTTTQQAIGAQSVMGPALPQQEPAQQDLATIANEQALVNQTEGANNSNQANLLEAYAQRGIGGSGQGILANTQAGAANEQTSAQSALNIGAQQQQVQQAQQQQYQQLRQQALQQYQNNVLQAGEFTTGQRANERQAVLSSDQQDANRRQAALEAAGNLSSTMASQDFNTQSTNANIINQYNQRNTMSKNAYAQYVANTVNQGNMFNINQNQQVANLNTQGVNQTNAENIMNQQAVTQNYVGAANQQNQTLANYGTGMVGMQGQADQAQLSRNAAMGATVATAVPAIATAYGNSGIQASQQNLNNSQINLNNTKANSYSGSTTNTNSAPSYQPASTGGGSTGLQANASGNEEEEFTT